MKIEILKNQNFGFFEKFFENIFQKIEFGFLDHKKFSAVTFEKINIFLQIQKHMKRIVRGFHFRYWTSKTDHYAKSYPQKT